MANNLLEKLKRGKNIYGTCIVSTSPIWSKSVKNSGLDFVFLDTEHIPMDRNELTVLCQIYTAMGISPIVRIPSPDPATACMVKDAGAVGVIAPYVENAEQIRQLVGATKYRPLKGERLQRVLNKEEVLEPVLKKYLEKYNEGSITIVNIESITALKNLDELLDVDGLDAIRSILLQAVHFLSPEGLLVAEVGNSWQSLEEAFPAIPFTWIELEHGGHGVFVLTAHELAQGAESLA